MVRITEELALSPEHVALYSTSDPLLGHLPVLIFLGPSTTANYTFNSSRVQLHIYSPAGFQSFPRVTISPNSPFYNVVNYLPREFQGDEVYRALAFGLFKYFHELPETVKNHVRTQFPTTKGRRPGSSPMLFGEQHAADVARAMVRSEQTVDVIQRLQMALQTQHISNVDIDLVLPPGSIIPLQPADLEEVPEDEDDILDPTLRQYGMYTPIIKLFGEPIFLPTSKLRRAPSKPTALNRSRSFMKEQKVDLRHKLSELVETEERYVSKVDELVKQIAADYKLKAKERAPNSASPSLEDVNKLFPKSSEKILGINTAFMKELRRVLDESEEDALKDMETNGPAKAGLMASESGKPRDPSGALAMAKLMLDYFPQFTECYQDYIRASQDFSKLINSFLKQQQSSFSNRVASTGEQHLRSMVIEPVQRLPRYSLMIDQIVHCLPITHPALQPMLKARDIIANICSMDDPLADKPHVTNRLRSMVESWPKDLEPKGRLIIAADFSEIPAPYNVDAPIDIHSDERAGMFLLFSDCLVIVKKVFYGKMTARDLLREIDSPSAAGLLASMTNAAGGPASYELAFAGWHNLTDIRFTESSDGRLVWMTSSKNMKGANCGEYVTNPAITSRCFLLQEAYEGKAMKWGEEIVKARVEGRFAEAEREDPCWTLRSVRMPDTGLGLFAAVFQEGLESLVEGRKEPAPIRIVVDYEKGTKGEPVGHYGVEIVSDVKTGDMSRVVVSTLGLFGKKSTDEVDLEDFLPALARRIIQLMSTQFTASNPSLTAALVSFHSKVLRGMKVSQRAEKSRSFLAASPVKMLTSFLSGNRDDAGSPPKHQRMPVASLFPPAPISRSNSSTKDSGSLYGSTKSRESVRLNTDDDRPENPLVRLEETFTGYMACLQAQKGNFFAQTIFNRSGVDELKVNDLYNKLIESPFDMDQSPDLTAVVVFAAFEKFIRIAWREQMGPIITIKALDALQERLSKRLPGDFADFVRFLFQDMAPQNRRAFTSLIKLLADLLDGCGNDGDRGALTLAFAELLVNDESAPTYINLMDRLVEDCDRIFDSGAGDFAVTLERAASIYESMNSATRSAKSHNGSVTSNSSSLRRKFDFLRSNSKTDGDGRSSVWRSLSKHGRHPLSESSSSLSKASLLRPRSTRANTIDMGTGSTKLFRRPGSRDRPPLAGAFDDTARPTTSYGLETIGEPDMEEPTRKISKKKRRSSLSDLRSLMEAAKIEDPALQPLSQVKQTSEKFNAGPRVPSPTRIPMSPTTNNRGAGQKENIADAVLGSPIVFPTSTPPSSGQKGSPNKKSHNRGLSASQIPTLKSYHSAPTPGSPPRPTTSGGRPTSARLRLQSPQKLRERLQTEKLAVDNIDANLQSELSRITEEMGRVNSSLPRTPTLDIKKLSSSVAALESRIPLLVKELSDRQDVLQRDMDNTLKATEAKVKAIDQLYNESRAENELLYERFNGELAKIVKALKGKSGGEKEELVTKMKEASEETARVKKENARLRREMASLRTLIKGAVADAA